MHANFRDDRDQATVILLHWNVPWHSRPRPCPKGVSHGMAPILSPRNDFLLMTLPQQLEPILGEIGLDYLVNNAATVRRGHHNTPDIPAITFLPDRVGLGVQARPGHAPHPRQDPDRSIRLISRSWEMGLKDPPTLWTLPPHSQSGAPRH